MPHSTTMQKILVKRFYLIKRQHNSEIQLKWFYPNHSAPFFGPFVHVFCLHLYVASCAFLSVIIEQNISTVFKSKMLKIYLKFTMFFVLLESKEFKSLLFVSHGCTYNELFLAWTYFLPFMKHSMAHATQEATRLIFSRAKRQNCFTISMISLLYD